MLITFSRPTSQGAGCLNVAFLPMRRRNPRPLGLSIRKLNILDSRGFGLAQAIRKVELGGLDIMSQKEKIRMEALSNNQRGYYVMYYAACPYRDGGAQGEKGEKKKEKTRTGYCRINSHSFLEEPLIDQWKSPSVSCRF